MAANGQSEAGGAHPPPSGGKKKNPFKEGRTMALSELLEGMPMTAGNWSEVVESTATVDSSDPKGGRVKPRADLPDAPRTARGEVEVDVSKVPQEPPFLAFVGNLSYNVTERDLRSFFGADSVNDVNFVLDRNTGRPRGFAYIEFHTRDDLICALGKSGSQLMNRDVKVDIQTGGSGGGSSDRRGNQNRQSSDIRSQQHQSSAYQPARTQQS
uniref:RRM domain-containing protein n=1 Tax=Plectus sambesii TaxID=2011161 RepID=A0A914UUQ6_9BILA